MPAIIISALKVVLGLAVGRILVGAGLSLVIYSGVSGFIDSALSNFDSLLSGLPADMVQILAIAGFGEGFSVFLGGVTAIIAITTGSRIVGVRLGSG